MHSKNGYDYVLNTIVRSCGHHEHVNIRGYEDFKEVVAQVMQACQQPCNACQYRQERDKQGK